MAAPALRLIDKSMVIAINTKVLRGTQSALILDRDRLLDSALMRPQLVKYYEPHRSVPYLAAALAESLVMNHPFADGNKRTAMHVSEWFLRANGFSLSMDRLGHALMHLANNELDLAALGALYEEAARPTPSK